MSTPIQTAELEWQCIDGIEIPVSKQFGDVYFSKDNGLLETRHVFLNGNDLSERLTQLKQHEYFCVGETGFGTGLNILALWQLWQNVRPDNQSHLHAISVEKFPLSKSDLIRALNAWPELSEFSYQLIEQYPHPIAGCHRLNFPNARFSIDLWLGDAHDVFPSMQKTSQVHAWFLDGFAPSCNPDMWEENVLNHIIRLSDVGTTFASFSVAGVLKRGLKQHGISITRPRGFGHKREMLKGIWLDQIAQEPSSNEIPPIQLEKKKHCLSQSKHIAVIGAGIAGLSTAHAFAMRGHHVYLFDETAPLSGGSGNPLALLNPKLCPIQQSHEHLMTLSWQHALRHYAKFKAFRPIQVKQLALKNPDQLLNLSLEYPKGLVQTSTAADQPCHTAYDSLDLIEAGAVSPHILSEEILAHPLIHLKKATITHIQHNDQPSLFASNEQLGKFDHVIVCTARHTAQFFENYPTLKPIRGQVSWVNNAEQALPLDTAFSYGGYCMQLDASQLILGASFWPQRDDCEILETDHVHNFDLIHSVFPNYAQALAPISTWQGRASIRAQSPDYFPVLGQVDLNHEVYSFAGLGSKGFLFAPLCAEILAATILNEACPVPSSLFNKLQARRFLKKTKVKKPYYQKSSIVNSDTKKAP